MMRIGDEVRWHFTADVVTVGFGAAGAAGAITAHDNGAVVLVLEKQPGEDHLSTSHMSGGFFICPSNIDAAMTYMEKLSEVEEDICWTDKEVIRVWAEYTAMNKQGPSP